MRAAIAVRDRWLQISARLPAFWPVGPEFNTSLMPGHEQVKRRLRKVIAEEMEKASPVAGEIEVDESYFGGVRKGKRGRGAAGKVPDFGLLKRGGKVYTVMIPNARTATLMPIMERMILPDSVVYTDGFSSHDALDVSDFHHVRINHSERFVVLRIKLSRQLQEPQFLLRAVAHGALSTLLLLFRLPQSNPRA